MHGGELREHRGTGRDLVVESRERADVISVLMEGTWGGKEGCECAPRAEISTKQTLKGTEEVQGQKQRTCAKQLMDSVLELQQGSLSCCCAS